MRSLIVFVKNLELGKVKTRLGKSIGDESALKVYAYLLAYTRKIAMDVKCDQIFVYHSSYINSKDDWQGDKIENKLQVKGDLGIKMSSAFKETITEKNDSVVLIGSDCLDITTEIINKAFDELEIKDVVLGPATDGGYYLIGMKEHKAYLFEDKPWSTGSLFRITVTELKEKGIRWSELEKISDIDVESDLKNKLNWKEL